MRSTRSIGPWADARGKRRLQLNCLVLALLAAILLPPAAPLSAAADEPSVLASRIRIGVVKDGITAVTPADLANVGVDPASVNPQTFAMSSLGQPVAIYVTGADDGKFDGGDKVYFFGQKFRGPEMDQKYTDERVYWLDMGGTAGPRMATLDATPQGNITPPTDFATTLHAEESLVWWSLTATYMDTQDTWFWYRFQVLSGSALTTTLPYTVPYPSNSPATLRLEMLSLVGSGVNPDHRTVAAMNGTKVLDQTWDGSHVRKVMTAAVPAGALTHGVNNLDVGAWLQPGVGSDDVYANYWEVDYRRLFRAFQEQIDFRSETTGTQEYAIAGWGNPAVMAWDITDPNQPVRFQVPAAGGPDMTLNFQVNTSTGNRYWLQGENAANPPASVRLRLPTGLRDPLDGADAVIVTSAALRPQAERLAKWHRQEGRRVLVVDFQDAVDEFNDGIYHPKGVQNMLKWAVDHWKAPAPQYLTLFGDGDWNMKGFNPAVYPYAPEQIPPYLAFEDPWQGEIPVDARYGDINDDKLPEIAVGRIAVNNLGEASAVVDKIVAYDEGPRVADWQRRMLYVSDNADAAGEFPTVSDSVLARFTPADMTPERVYLPPIPVSDDQLASTRADLFNALDAGALVVQYTGHGAPERWTHELLFTTADIPSLSNGPRYPVVMTFNCLDGYFVHPNPARFSMAELMQRQPNGGSIAAISPTGLGTTSDQLAFREVLLTVMFKDNVRELGKALTIAKRRFSQVYGVHYLTQSMTLYGDPALKLAGGDIWKSFLPSLRR